MLHLRHQLRYQLCHHPRSNRVLTALHLCYHPRPDCATYSAPSALRLCHQPRSGNVSHQFRSFRPRLVTFTEQANTAYRHLRGRLPCAVKPIGPHRASEYALHLSGTAFGLLGVLLEGPSATDTGFRHPEPPHDRSPSVLGLFFGQI